MQGGSTELWKGKSRIELRALWIGERIDTRALEKTKTLGYAPLTLAVGKDGCACIFRYGSVVLFRVGSVEEVELLEHLQSIVGKPLDKPEVEEAVIRVDPTLAEGVSEGVISVKVMTVAHVQTIAEVMAKSVLLQFYEGRIAKDFEAVEPFAEHLRHRGASGLKTRDLLKHLGETLLHQHNMVGRVEVSEKPDLLWDHPQLERLYLHLEDEFELRERHIALERKLSVISNTTHTVMNLLDTKRSLRVEWYIVGLIVFEILLTLYEMFLRPRG